MRRVVMTLLAGATVFLGAIGCHRTAVNAPRGATIYYVAAANLAVSPAGVALPAEGGLITLDSASLRPSLVARGGIADFERLATVTTYQGGRYRPETIRAITGDSLVLASTARAVATEAWPAGRHLLLDFQGVSPTDLPQTVEMVRAIAAAARARSLGPVAFVVPPGDTISYPTTTLARVADLLAVRLNGEHRHGTRPGPLTTPAFIAREVGLRAKEIGINRIIGELPLYGFRWNADGSAAPITYAAANELALAQSAVFRRDPASRFLVASGREGWTVWVPDATTVEAMIAAVRRTGVKVITLAGVAGSDPEIPERVRQAVRR